MEGKRSRASERASRAAIEGAQFAASAVEPNFENVKRQKTNGGHEGRNGSASRNRNRNRNIFHDLQHVPTRYCSLRETIYDIQSHLLGFIQMGTKVCAWFARNSFLLLLNCSAWPLPGSCLAKQTNLYFPLCKGWRGEAKMLKSSENSFPPSLSISPFRPPHLLFAPATNLSAWQ